MRITEDMSMILIFLYKFGDILYSKLWNAGNTLIVQLTFFNKSVVLVSWYCQHPVQFFSVILNFFHMVYEILCCHFFVFSCTYTTWVLHQYVLPYLLYQVSVQQSTTSANNFKHALISSWLENRWISKMGPVMNQMRRCYDTSVWVLFVLSRRHWRVQWWLNSTGLAVLLHHSVWFRLHHKMFPPTFKKALQNPGGSRIMLRYCIYIP